LSTERADPKFAHLDTTTKQQEEINSLSSSTGGEGWGEEVQS